MYSTWIHPILFNLVLLHFFGLILPYPQAARRNHPTSSERTPNSLSFKAQGLKDQSNSGPRLRPKRSSFGDDPPICYPPQSFKPKSATFDAPASLVTSTVLDTGSTYGTGTQNRRRNGPDLGLTNNDDDNISDGGSMRDDETDENDEFEDDEDSKEPITEKPTEAKSVRKRSIKSTSQNSGGFGNYFENYDGLSNNRKGMVLMKIMTQKQTPRNNPFSTVSPSTTLSRELRSFPSVTPSTQLSGGRFTAPSTQLSGGQNRDPSHADIPCDDYVCDCSAKKKQATCCGRNYKLHHIPRVPSYTRRFRLWQASIQHLDRATIANLSNFNVEEMDLRNNKILTIANDTFVDFPDLRTLDLGFNPITAEMLRDAFYSLTAKNFRHLRLDNMNFEATLPADFLIAFRNRSLKTLSLQTNGLTAFQARVFSGLRSVDKLFLSNNDLRSFKLDAQVWVQTLKLEQNSFTSLPVLCMDDKSAAFPNLFSLYMADNPLKEIPARSLKGKCLPKLRKLDISGASVQCLENNFLADLPDLQNVMISRMRRLKRYDPFCFNSSSVRLLSIQDSQLDWVRGTVDPTHLFAHSPLLHTLQLSGTGISIPDDQLRSILLSLQSLKILKLARCKLGAIPPDTLWRLRHLTDLDLNSNHLNSFTLSAALKNVTQILTLRAQGNNINTVTQTTLPEEFRRSVRTLDLSRNPFDCTCELLWFTAWADQQTKSGNITITSYPRQYHCNTPADLKHALLSEYNPSYRDCHPINVYVVGGGVGGGTLFLLVFSLSLAYRFRWYLRYYMYRFRRRRQYKRLSNDEEDPFAYDVYLGYSERDLEWVVGELMPLLEVEAQQRVYLKNRDIRGGTEADNIVNNMDRSQHVLLVLSDHYSQDRWSGFEFQNALFAAQEQGKEVLVVLKESMKASRMSKDMCRMLTNGTFLQWEDSPEARSTFKEGLLLALKDSGGGGGGGGVGMSVNGDGGEEMSCSRVQLL